MNGNHLNGLSRLESDLWEAANQLRANSKLTSSEYCMPVLGVIFLRHAANRFEIATRQIEEDIASGRMPRRTPIKADYLKRRALYLPEVARYDYLVDLPTDSDLGQALVNAMTAIEEDFQPLQGNLPKDYTIFERTVLEDLLRIFNRESLKTAQGDVFGRIYEYFLMKFAMQGAQDGGEFFTPPSIVQTIVNVIEPDHGIVFDPACGSGGMFVQSSHFIERQGENTARRVTFYGQEKTATTIRLAKMNLAVHGLEGDIREANTFYEDVHTLHAKCDFVMANPPFNVDMVDAERVKDDARLPFGLPGVNKNKKVSNGNYLWISYFYSYLNEQGRAGFVMSSQASSAGHGEKDVRRKIVETCDVDVMISIRSNFFYTRSVPCELWFFDRSKPEHLRDKVLMLDARNIYRKVTRKVNDFSPEQLSNLSAIVWLYRGRTDRFLGLVRDYFGAVCRECELVPDALVKFEEFLGEVLESLSKFCIALPSIDTPEGEITKPLRDAESEIGDAVQTYAGDRARLLKEIDTFRSKSCKPLPADNEKQHAARAAIDGIAGKIKALISQLDSLFKQTSRMADLAGELTTVESLALSLDRRTLGRQLKKLDEYRKDVVEQLRLARYFYRQIVWLQDRFPDAALADVPGLVKLVERQDIETADWSLTPGRYVGVAPQEDDEGFDFGLAIREIHLELLDLHEEATELMNMISKNLSELDT